MLRNIFFIGIFLLAPLFTHAQTVPGGNTFIRTEPRYPVPEKEITVFFTSYEGDLDSALISWFKDGKLIERGRGLTSIKMRAPKAGVRIEIVAHADLVNGRVIASEHILSPSSVTILVNAQTHTPPFYKGKAIPTVGGNVNLIALPEFYDSSGKPIDPDTLSYEWWAESGQLEKVKGRSTVLKNPIFMRDIRVMVTVFGPGGRNAESDTLIPARTPSIVLYENDPSLGVWYNTSVPPSFLLNKAEVSLHAEPYFFSKSIIPSLSFDWTLPGSSAPYRSSNQRLVLRPEEGASGLSVINLSAHDALNNVVSMFQQAKTSFSVRYSPEILQDTSGGQTQVNTNSPLPNF